VSLPFSISSLHPPQSKPEKVHWAEPAVFGKQ